MSPRARSAEEPDKDGARIPPLTKENFPPLSSSQPVRTVAKKRGKNRPCPQSKKPKEALSNEEDGMDSDVLPDPQTAATFSQPPPSPPPPVKRRGPGKPSITGEYCEVAATRLRQAKEEQEEMEREREREVPKNLKRFESRVRAQLSQARREYSRLYEDEKEERKSARKLAEMIREGTNLISAVAVMSPNLKETFVKTLRDTARSIKEMSHYLSTHTRSEETQRLERENMRIKKELDSFIREMKEMRRELSSLRSMLLPLFLLLLQNPVRGPRSLDQQLDLDVCPHVVREKGRRDDG